MKRLLPLALLALAACSSSSPPAPTTSAAPASSPSASRGEPPVAGPSIAPGTALTAVAMTTSLGPDGAAQGATDTFDRARDHQLIAVLTLSGISRGTKLSYVRYLDGKYVDSRSAVTVGSPRFFYFEFTAPAGEALTPGSYRLRLYVAEHAVGEVSYRVR